MNTVTVRAMRPGDVDAVAAIAAQSPGEGWTPAELRRELELPTARYLVAVEGDGTVVGFAGAWLVVDLAHVTNMGVATDRRRRGIGQVLLHGLVALAQRERMDAMTLEVRPSNAAARALYTKFGFYVTGERKSYYADTGEDALILTTESIHSSPYRERMERIADRFGGSDPGAVRRGPGEDR